MLDYFTYLIYLSLLGILLFLTSYKQKSATNEIDFEIIQKLRLKHFVALLIISFIAGFRYNVGIDWNGYKDTFTLIKNHPSLTLNKQHMEIGYFYINKLIALLGWSYEWMFFSVALISWYFVFKSLPNFLLPLLLFFLFVDEYFFWSMNGVRQFVAISIFLYSIRYIISKNLLFYIVFILLASLFHYSALFLLPVYFIPFKDIYNQKYWITAFSLSFVFAQTPFLVNGLKQLLIAIGNYIPVMSNYLFYLEGTSYKSRELTGTGLGVVFKNLITLFILIYSKTIIKKYPQSMYYFILFFFGAIVNNLFFTFQIVGRFNIYFLILRTIILALIVFELLNKKTTQTIAYGIIILYFIIFLWAIYNSSNMCNPYQFTF